MAAQKHRELIMQDLDFQMKKAAEEVDVSLIQWMLSLSPMERLRDV